MSDNAWSWFIVAVNVANMAWGVFNLWMATKNVRNGRVNLEQARRNAENAEWLRRRLEEVEVAPPF